MRGYTLVELVLVLLLMGIAAVAFVPAARGYRDRAAVTAAREAVVGLLSEARLGAVERGRGVVRLVAHPWRGESLAGGVNTRAIDLSAEFGVDLRVGGSPDTVEIRYDALGLGQVASRTILFVRGDEAAELVVSAFGRVSRR